MMLPRRIRTIYVKELIDILRDRRTLIAMILVPILLYPLLMIGSIQAVSVQAEKLREEKAVLITVDESQSQLLQNWIAQDANVMTALAEAEGREQPAETTEPEDEPQPETLELFEVRHFTDADSVDNARRRMEELVQSRHLHVGVIIDATNTDDQLTRQFTVELVYDPEEYRSGAVAGRLIDVVQRRARLQRLSRLDYLRIDPIVIKPFVIERTKVTTPGSILGQILPLVLVLMTIHRRHLPGHRPDRRRTRTRHARDTHGLPGARRRSGGRQVPGRHHGGHHGRRAQPDQRQRHRLLRRIRTGRQHPGRRGLSPRHAAADPAVVDPVRGAHVGHYDRRVQLRPHLQGSPELRHAGHHGRTHSRRHRCLPHRPARRRHAGHARIEHGPADPRVAARRGRQCGNGLDRCCCRPASTPPPPSPWPAACSAPSRWSSPTALH